MPVSPISFNSGTYLPRRITQTTFGNGLFREGVVRNIRLGIVEKERAVGPVLEPDILEFLDIIDEDLQENGHPKLSERERRAAFAPITEEERHTPYPFPEGFTDIPRDLGWPEDPLQ